MGVEGRILCRGSGTSTYALLLNGRSICLNWVALPEEQLAGLAQRTEAAQWRSWVHE